MKKEIIKEEKNDFMGNSFVICLIFLAVVGLIHVVLFNVNSFNKYIDSRASDIAEEAVANHQLRYDHYLRREEVVSGLIYTGGDYSRVEGNDFK